MPIMNMIVSGGGGGQFSGVEVEVVNGVMQKKPTQRILDFSGVTEIQKMQYLYAGLFNLDIPNGIIDMGSVTTIGVGALSNTFVGITSYNTVNLGALTTILASGLEGAFSSGGISSSTPITVDMHSLVSVEYDSAMYCVFQDMPVSSLNLNNLTVLGGSLTCTMAFSGNALTTLELPSLETIYGQNTAQAMFTEGTVSTVLMPKLKTISGSYTARQMFADCLSLASVDWSALNTLSGTAPLFQTFYGCVGMTSLNLSNLRYLDANGACQQMLRGCSNLTDLRLPNIYPNSFGSSYANQFVSMCVGIPSITLHFPSNVQSVVEALSGYNATAPFGADAGTVLFDLPATVTLTGADTFNYERNPKYDTATALGWFDATNGDMSTPYYTAGVLDPVANDTIYSDADCTAPVTTISSIS